MITEEQIPQECIKALQKTMLSEGATFASMAVAMLAAWPGRCIGESKCGWHRYIELPLPQED